MIELGTPGTLMDTQSGHSDGSVQARYSHITGGMRQRLTESEMAAPVALVDVC